MTSMDASSELEELVETFAARREQFRSLLVVRLATLRQIMHRSATLAFGRETGLNDFDWLVLSFVGAHEGAIVSTICERLRRDKGQVSRAVSRLTRRGLVRREHLRAPIELTARGVETNARIDRLLRERNRALLEGVSVEERVLLDGALDKMFRAANELLAYERRLASAADAGPEPATDRPARGEDKWRSVSAQADPRSPEWLVMPDLDVLLRLMRQSAGLAHGRVTQLSHFDWLTVTHIAAGGPMTLADLIAALDRNKSQVGRAVARLEGLGLVDRRKQPGVPSAVLTATPAGREAYERVLAEAKRRDAALIEGLPTDDFRKLLSVFDRLTHNALDLLRREREVGSADVRALT